MINIDSNDFALLVKNVAPGSRPIQGLGDREIFYNDVEQLPGGPMPHDNKTYMKCRRAGQKTPLSKPVVNAPLGATSAKDKKTVLGHVQDFVSNQVAANGWISVIDALLMIAAFGIGVWAAWLYSDQISFILALNTLSQSIASYLRKLVGLDKVALPITSASV
jgi:hypothetical protein